MTNPKPESIPKPVEVVNELNGSLFLYKNLTVGLLILAIILSTTLAWQLTALPIVIVKEGSTKTYHVGTRKKTTLTKEDITRFVENFITRRYTVKEFNPDKLTEKLSCIATRNFLAKLKKILGTRKHNNGKTKIEQYAAFIKSTVKDGKALATFDKVLRINGVPIASTVELSLQIVERERTECNPQGLYVNGVKEFIKR